MDAIIDGVPHRSRVNPDGVIAELAPAPDAHGASLRWTGGFVDIHSHGGGGLSYDDADAEGLRAALRVHRDAGTGRALLSLVSAPLAELAARLRRLRDLLPSLPGVFGVHLEGPFLAPERRGAHAPHALTLPTPEAVDLLLEAGGGIVRQVTIAPELPGALAAIERFVAAGVVVAVGHTQADEAAASAAFDRGASLLTHAFNAMAGFGHRDPGPVGAALARDHVALEVIADGFHLHPVVVRTLFAAAPGRVVLVSDAMSATGLGDGEYLLGGLAVQVERGRPVLAGTDTLAGSTLTLDRAIAAAVAAGVPVDAAIAAATSTPERIFGLASSRPHAGDRLESVVALDPSGHRVTPPGH